MISINFVSTLEDFSNFNYLFIVVVQAVAEDKKSRFSIERKKPSTSGQIDQNKTETEEELVESTITNRFSVTSVTKANEELTEDSNREIESEKSSLSSNNEESEEVAILKPVETTDDSFIKPKVSKLSNRFSVKSVTEEKTEKPQPKSSIASRFSIKSVSKDDSTSKITEVEQGLMDKPEAHLSQSRFVVKSVKETEEQVPYETDNDSVFTDDQPAENADLEVMFSLC